MGTSLLVAIHMVYSKAHKRQEAMQVMGWWRSNPVESDKRSQGRRRHVLESDGGGGGGHGGGGGGHPAPRRSLHAVAGPAAAFAAKMAAGSGAGAGASAGAGENTNANTNTCPVPEPPSDEPATSPANRGVLFTHTYFRQMEPGNRAFVCAGRAPPGGCPCCRALPDQDTGDGGGDVSWVKAVAEGVQLARGPSHPSSPSV